MEGLCILLPTYDYNGKPPPDGRHIQVSPLHRESYHLGSHFGSILGPFGGGLGGLKTVFLVILGLLKFVKNSPTLSLWGV